MENAMYKGDTRMLTIEGLERIICERYHLAEMFREELAT